MPTDSRSEGHPSAPARLERAATLAWLRAGRAPYRLDAPWVGSKEIEPRLAARESARSLGAK